MVDKDEKTQPSDEIELRPVDACLLFLILFII